MGSPAKKQKMTEISHFDNPKFSDLLIKFSGREFHAHKVTVCQNSGYFRNALEKDFAESHTGVVDLKDHDKVEIIFALLRHIYGLPYDQSVGTELDKATPSTDLLFHVDVFAAADYYDVPSLRELVAQKIPVLMDTRLRQSIAIAKKGTKADEGRFKLPSPQDNLNAAIRHIFAHEYADHSLQESVVEFCVPRMFKLAEYQTFRATLKEAGSLPAALLDVIFDSSSELLKCSSCDRVFRLGDQQCPKCETAEFDGGSFLLELEDNHEY